VKWRVAWLRAEFPTAQIVTEQIEGDAEHARFKCTITLPNGAVSSGHGSETAPDFPDFYEKAETKAIGRACAVLGYGTDAASDFDDGEPMDGRAAAKDERATRHADAPDGADNVTPIGAANRTRPEVAASAPTPAPAPSRLPATRRGPSNGVSQPEAHSTSTLVATPASDDRSNVHQHAQLRSLVEHGFDLASRLQSLQAGDIEELTREQAKELIIEGRASVRGGHSLN
ncbi:MAG: hypothetical protein M3008_11215, partial [Chloroflexota bacterium]|nr:hypothetical protein [Chloroflexota bacterium]